MSTPQQTRSNPTTRAGAVTGAVIRNLRLLTEKNRKTTTTLGSTRVTSLTLTMAPSSESVDVTQSYLNASLEVRQSDCVEKNRLKMEAALRSARMTAPHS